MRTSHIWPVIALLSLLWPAVAALAQDMWVTTPDGTLSIPLYSQPGGGLSIRPPPAVQPQQTMRDELPVVATCLNLEAMLQLPISPTPSNPRPTLTPGGERDFAQCQDIKRRNYGIVQQIRDALDTCASEWAMRFVFQDQPETPEKRRIREACEDFEKWIAAYPPPQSDFVFRPTPEPPAPPAVNETPGSSAGGAPAAPEEPWRVISVVPHEPARAPRGTTSR